MNRAFNTDVQIITNRTAYDVAVAFAKKEAKVGIGPNGAIVRIICKDTDEHVEVIYVDGLVCISTFYGRPRRDGGNIHENQTFDSVRDFYKKYELGGF